MRKRMNAKNVFSAAAAALVALAAWALPVQSGAPAAAADAQQAPPTVERPKAGAHDNTPPEGFQAAFNGKDLTGWKGLVSPDKGPPGRKAMKPEELAEAQKKADEEMRAHWSVQDGVLVFDGKGQSLVMEKEYGDFEMYVDWMILENGDSGVYVRGTPQIQIWDPKFHEGVGSGGLYNNQKPENPSKPSETADNPIGQWNTFHIKMVGEKVWVKLNGKMVVDGVVLENYWERDKPIYPVEQIELQNHGNTLYFKNVYIKELPAGGGDAAAKVGGEQKK